MDFEIPNELASYLDELDEFIEREIAFSKELMETQDFAFAKEQLDKKVETVGLTEEGRAWIDV